MAQCILDRVKSSEFKGDTIKAIVSAKGQFYGYRAKNPIWDELIEVAERALNGEQAFPEYEVLYFHESRSTKDWHAPYIGRIGGHSFYGYEREVMTCE